MKSLLERLLIEAKEITAKEWHSYKNQNREAITKELEAIQDISTAKNLKLASKSRAD